MGQDLKVVLKSSLIGSIRRSKSKKGEIMRGEKKRGGGEREINLQERDQTHIFWHIQLVVQG